MSEACLRTAIGDGLAGQTPDNKHLV